MKNGQEKYDVKMGIRELKRYLEYKDSGVEWIGEIPQKWEVKSFKRVTTRVDVGIAEAATHAYSDKGTPIIRSTNVRPNKLLLDDIYYIQKWFAEKNRSKYLHSGDIVTVRTGNAGVSAVIPHSLHMSQCFTLLISTLSSNQIPQFYCYYLNSRQGQTDFQIEGWGTAQINISVPILQNLSVPEPPFEEQIEIVNFLDRETSKIDTLIEKKQLFIELLEEKRSALISHAVTKGLDPDVKTRDSEVEWIGKIPENWEITQLKFCYDVQLGKMLQNEASSIQDTLEPYLRAANIKWKGVDVADIKEMWFGPQEKKKYLLEIGDLLVSEGGDVGRSAIWNRELQNCYIQNAINRVRAKRGFNTRFLFYWMYFLKHSGLIDIICDKATIAHLTAEKLERILVPIINESEQLLIVSFLDQETQKIDTLINKISAQIEKLKEYRTVLISAAVTGKIDVREEVA